MLLQKMVILPVIGIAFVQSLSAHTTLYPKEDKMLRFVAMLLVRPPSPPCLLPPSPSSRPLTDVLTLFARSLARPPGMVVQSGTPTAVNQLVVTQLCAPEGGADTLAAFLLPQYAVMSVRLFAPCALPFVTSERSGR